jgi:hypothetical protein
MAYPTHRPRRLVVLVLLMRVVKSYVLTGSIGYGALQLAACKSYISGARQPPHCARFAAKLKKRTFPQARPRAGARAARTGPRAPGFLVTSCLASDPSAAVQAEAHLLDMIARRVLRHCDRRHSMMGSRQPGCVSPLCGPSAATLAGWWPHRAGCGRLMQRQVCTWLNAGLER